MSEKWNGIPDFAKEDGQHWLREPSGTVRACLWKAGDMTWVSPVGEARIGPDEVGVFGLTYWGRAIPPTAPPAPGAPEEERADDLIREHVAAHKALNEANQNIMDGQVARDDAQRRLEVVTGLWNAYRRHLIARAAMAAGIDPQEIPS